MLVNPKLLHAAAVISANDPGRPHIGGVSCVVVNGEAVAYVATDSYRMVAVVDLARTPDRPHCWDDVTVIGDRDSDVTFPCEVVAAVDKKAVAPVDVTRIDGGWRVSGGATTTVVDGGECDFPNWRSLLPPRRSFVDGDRPAVNPTYLADWAKVVKMIERRNPPPLILEGMASTSSMGGALMVSARRQDEWAMFGALMTSRIP